MRNDVVWCDAVRCGAIRYGVVHVHGGARSGTMSVHGACCVAMRYGAVGAVGGRQGALAAPASLAGEDVDLVAAPCLRKGWDGM